MWYPILNLFLGIGRPRGGEDVITAIYHIHLQSQFWSLWKLRKLQLLRAWQVPVDRSIRFPSSTYNNTYSDNTASRAISRFMSTLSGHKPQNNWYAHILLLWGCYVHTRPHNYTLTRGIDVHSNL